MSDERRQAAELRRQAAEDPDNQALYLTARLAKRQLFFRDPALAPLERILFAKRHPFLESHNYSEHLDGILEPGRRCTCWTFPATRKGRFRPDRARIQQLFDGSEGIVREPVADYDARTIYFAYRPDKPGRGWASYWHMYAMQADGSGLRKADRRAVSRFRCGLPARRRLWLFTARGARSASSAGGRRPTCCTGWRPTARTSGGSPTPT
jgi:hypothetical protein